MIQNRVQRKIDLGGGLVKYITRLETEPAPIEYKRQALLELLYDIYTNPSLAACGKYDFDSIRIYFNNDRWLAEAEFQTKEEEEENPASPEQRS